MHRSGKILLIAPLALLGIAAFAAIGGGIVMLLWNALLPPLFALPAITFWQALGLLVLSRILFGGFGLHGSRRSPIRDRVRGRMEERMSERCAAMTPEERERFRQRMRAAWGFEPPPESGGGEGPTA